jgi:hypothetical protein
MARYRGTNTSATYTTGDDSRRGPRSKWRKGVAGTALAAAAMAALTASQAPGAQLGDAGGEEGKDRGERSRPDLTPGDDSYHTELPPLESPAPPKSHDNPDVVGSHSGIPATVLAAYKKAERALASTDRGCGLRWELLAAIGKVESGQARGGAVDKEGTTLRPILGPVLNGSGFARIEDTDGGRFDGDARFDRAVGPMQFIPSTWSRWGADGNGDGTDDPDNIYDSALAAGQYLCAGGKDLGSKSGLDRAVLSYNHSRAYLRTVLAWYEFYREGTHAIPDGNGPLPTTPGAGAESDGPGKGKGDGKGKGEGGKGKPGKDKPGKGDGDDGDGGGGSDDRPSPTPSTPAALERVGDGRLSAGTGQDFAEPPRVKVLDDAGKPVEGVDVEFEITGDTTGSEFEGDGTVATRADGTATAPTLNAGDAAGRFTVTATVAGSGISSASFTATVEPRATALTFAAGSLTTAKGTPFAEQGEIRATYKGKAVANVPMTATLLSGKGKPLESGPRFNLLGAPDRAVTGTTADGLLGLTEKGVFRLPVIHTDDTTGKFILRITTPGGPSLDVKLTVTD